MPKFIRYETKIQLLATIYPQLGQLPWFKRIIENRINIGSMNSTLEDKYLNQTRGPALPEPHA